MKFLTVAIFVAGYAVAASADDHSGITVDTLVNKQRELMSVQLDNKIKEEENKGKSAAIGGAGQLPSPANELGAVHLPATDPDGNGEFKLIGIFGVGDDLEAEIDYKKTVIPLRMGMDLDGWALYRVDGHSVTLRKIFSGKPSGKAVEVVTVEKILPPLKVGSQSRKVIVKQYAKTLRLYMSPVRDVELSRDEISTNNRPNAPASMPIPTAMPSAAFPNAMPPMPANLPPTGVRN